MENTLFVGRNENWPPWRSSPHQGPRVCPIWPHFDKALQKWKTHFSWDETKINLRGIPRHPKVHVIVRYGLVSTNYAMIRTKPSSSLLLKRKAVSGVALSNSDFALR
jgi:hypothetical protein